MQSDNALAIACAELAGYSDGFEGMPLNATFNTSDENLAYQLWFGKARKVRSDLIEQIDTLAKRLTVVDWQPYAQHKHDCEVIIGKRYIHEGEWGERSYRQKPSNDCTCGLAELLAAPSRLPIEDRLQPMGADSADRFEPMYCELIRYLDAQFGLALRPEHARCIKTILRETPSRLPEEPKDA